MSRSPAALALSVRLARREVLRRPGRTLLVALLVALPVAAMAVAAVLVRTERITTEQWWELWNGRADLAQTLDGSSDPDAADPVIPPGGTAVVADTAWNAGLRTGGGERLRTRISDLAIDDPLVQGIVRVDEGRSPQKPGEIALSTAVADELGVEVGDTVRFDRPTEQEVVVTGIVTLRRALSESVILVAPGEDLLGVPPDERTAFVAFEDATTIQERVAWLRAHETGLALELSPELHEARWGEPLEITDGSSDAAVRWTWVIGGVVLTVVGIVIAAAFAAGARRQLTTLGQLAANGADARVLRRTLFLQGTWTGAVGSALGLAIAAGVLALGRRWLDVIIDHDVDGYVVRVGDMVPIFLIGVVAATVAALVPARSTSRTPVLAALAGRRPLGRVPRWVTVSGFVAALAGLGLFGLAVLGGSSDASGNAGVWAATAILGGVAILLGACAIAPAFVSVLDRVSPHLGGPWRFAARSLSRQRTRTGAVVSAVCATSALAIAVSALVTGAMRADEESAEHRTDEVHVVTIQHEPRWSSAIAPPQSFVDELREVVPDAEVLQLTVVSGWLDRSAVVLDEAAVRAYGLSPSDRDAIEHAGAAILVKRDGFGFVPPIAPGAPLIQFTPVVYGGGGLGMLGNALVSEATVRELDLEVRPGPVVLRNPEPLTDEQRDRLDDVIEDYLIEHPTPSITQGVPFEYTSASHFAPPDGPSPFVLEAVLSGVALVFALFVVATSLALAATETRDERDVLVVVGASPATIRRTSAHKAALLTVMGALLAIPVGYLPVVVFTQADGNESPWLVFPWRTVALLLVAVPAITALATTAASALALRLRPVRVSTMTFD